MRAVIGFAWYLQKVVSAFNSALRGGRMFGAALFSFLDERTLHAAAACHPISLRGLEPCLDQSRHRAGGACPCIAHADSGASSRVADLPLTATPPRADPPSSTHTHTVLRLGAAAGGVLAKLPCFPKDKAFDPNDSYLDEAVGYIVAAAGFYTQLAYGFHLAFPVNLILLPLSIVEWILEWQIVMGSGAPIPSG